MISRLQILMQRHHKILFGSLLVVVVVAFVLTFGPTGGFGQRQKKFKKQEFFGYNLASENDVKKIFFDAEISMWLKIGFHTTRNEYLETYALVRTAGLAKADEYGIPEPTDLQYEKYLKDSQLFKEQDGTFSAAKFTNFTEQVNSSASVSQNDVARIVREDWRIQEVRQLIAGSGYTLPFEMEKFMENDETVWSVEVASLDYNKFQPEITPDDEVLKAFYEENPVRYESPEMIGTTLVSLDGNNYISEVQKPAEMEMIDYFTKNIERYRRLKSQQQAAPPTPLLPDSANPNPPEEPQFPEFRSQVESDLMAERANRKAAEQAVKMTYDIYRAQTTRNSPALTKIIEKYGAKTRSIAPYSMNRPPFNTGIMDFKILSSVFNLDDERFWSEVAVTSKGAALLLFDERIAPVIPPFEEVKAQVDQAYKVEERKKLFLDKGEADKATLEEALAAGSTFKEKAEELGMVVQAFENFAGNNPPEAFKQNLFTQGKNMEVGRISPMVFTENQGKFVYLKKKELPDLSEKADAILGKLKEQNDLVLPATEDTIMAEIMKVERDKSKTEKPESEADSDDQEEVDAG